MAGIAEIVQVTITANTRTPTRKGFGTPLLLAYHTKWTDLVRTYVELSDLISDGFTVNDAVYKMATALLSQNPRPERFKVGRLTVAHSQVRQLTVGTATAGDVISCTIVSPDGTETAITRTVPGASSLTAEATAVAALIDAIAALVATSAVAVITVTPAAAGGVWYVKDLRNLTVTETAVDAGYATALGNIQLVDDDWYFVLVDVNSRSNVIAVATWTETQTKLFSWMTQDSGELSNSGTITSTSLQGSNRARSFGLAVVDTEEFGACAWVGATCTKDPGSITFKFKRLSGVTPSSLTPTQETNLRSHNLNFFATVAGLGITQEGVMADGEFIDIQHGVDWLQARIQERVFGILANADKVPYSDASVDMIAGEIESVLEIGVQRNFLLVGTTSASGPKVADVDPADRAARLLPDMKFGGNFAGAIHKTKISGSLSV